MSELPLPKLTESLEEARQKIRTQITKGTQILNLPRLTSHKDRLKAYANWSRYNRDLLIKLFGSPFVANRDYNILGDNYISQTLSGIDSLEGIYERLGLYVNSSESSNTIQHSFGSDVFIVHGRDDGAKDSVARVVSEDLGLKPIILQEQPDKGNTVIEKLERCSSNVGYAIALVTSDDIGAFVLPSEIWATL